MAADIETFKFAIDYTFNNRALLKEALTHRSYSAETQLKYDNQRLEFLGDAVLEIILTEFLYHKYPKSPEGVMTKMRSALAQQDSLATLARVYNLGSFMLLGHGEKSSGGTDRDSTLCDLYESILGAIYLDGGLEEARRFVLDGINKTFPEPHQLLLNLNPKGTLQEYSQRKWGQAPTYNVIDSHGPDHSKTFVCEVTIQDYTAQGTGASRRLAESDAARGVIGQIAAKDESINDFV